MSFGSMLLAGFGIGLLIFLHELGHFMAARLAGVRVEVFSLGFGTRLCGFVWRGTDFRVSLVPFGGYVMVAGQDPGDRRYPARECLWSKSPGQRALFWSGGVLMNLLFALVAFPIVFRIGVAFTAPVVGEVARGGAAWEARITPGDRIVSIAGKALYSFENLVVETALTGGRPTALVVRGSDGAERTVTVLPQWNAGEGRYELGIDDSLAPDLPVLAIGADSPAATAGLRDGDVLLRIDDHEPRGAGIEPAVQVLNGAVPFTAVVRRDGAEHTVHVAPRPAKVPAPARIGVTLQARQVAGLRQGVPYLEQLGLRRGDTVLAVDDVPFTGNDLACVRGGGPVLRLHVRRDGVVHVLERPATAADRDAVAEHVALRAGDDLVLSPMPDQAAAAAGLRPGDRLLAVGGRPVRSFEALRDTVERAKDAPLTLTVQSPRPAAGAAFAADPTTLDLACDAPRELTIQPRITPLHESGITARLTKVTQEVRAESLGEALRLGALLSLDMIKQLYVTMKRMVTGDVGAKNLGGIIRISQISYQAAQRGTSWFLYLLAMLSLNLAFVNLLPIPVLDGGHLLFVLIEKVKGSPVSTRVAGYSQVVGLVFVLMLVLFVTYNDILQLL